MKKLLTIASLSLLLAQTAAAQEIDLVSGLVSDSLYDSQPVEEKEVVSKKDDTNIADDRGVFSFLNFSFIKKPLSLFTDDEEDTTDDNDQATVVETPLQRKIRKANEGDLNAQLTLGYMYLYGEKNVQTDFTEAFKYYEMAANQNSPIALNNLGSLYFNGIGTKRNYYKAAQLFSKAAELGSDDAALNLAFIYLSKDSNSQMHSKSIELFKQAAQAGNNTAKFMLGYAYYKGFEVEQDYAQAIRYIKDSARANFDEAQYVLALMYYHGHGIAQNYGNTVYFLNQASTQGHQTATMLLADIYATGRVYPKNEKKAHTFYNIAAINGTPNAAQKRDEIRTKLKIEELLDAQAMAESFKATPSELTTYIRQTFGSNIRNYIDNNMKL